MDVVYGVSFLVEAIIFETSIAKGEQCCVWLKGVEGFPRNVVG